MFHLYSYQFSQAKSSVAKTIIEKTITAVHYRKKLTLIYILYKCLRSLNEMRVFLIL